MKKIFVIDQTLGQAAKNGAQALSFREKMEIAKHIAAMHPDMLDAGEIKNEKADAVLLHAIAPEMKDMMLGCRCQLDEKAVDCAVGALSAAENPCVILVAPSSPVRMEYDGHRKAPAMIEAVEAMTKYAAEKCAHVMACFEDATRAEKEFLTAAMNAALASGAEAVIAQDMVGTLLPDEFAAFIEEIKASLPADAKLMAGCSNDMDMAAADLLSALMHGADGVCTAVGSGDCADTAVLAHALQQRGDRLGMTCALNHTELKRAAAQIEGLITARKNLSSPFAGGVREEEGAAVLAAGAEISAVAAAVKDRGYELSPEDMKNVFEAIGKLPAGKEVTGRELDAVIASFAMQVPPSYKLVSYHVNCSNIIAPTAHVVIKKDGKEMQGLSVGDGPIDAAFLAIEQIAGRHFELDDFQIQSVTEGRGAMGDALVKLRHEGRLYSGKGLSTDILGASIRAYINALNKIAYEENNA